MLRVGFALRTLVSVACLGVGGAAAEEPKAPIEPTYSIRYRVRISPRVPTIARVRWELAGIDEIRVIRLGLRGKDFYDFSGSGRIEQQGAEIVWRPAGPYAHLDYKVRLRHQRHTGQGFDSYATDDWAIARAQALFPAAHVTFALDVERNPRSRSEVVFDLPPGWKSYAAMETIAPNRFRPRYRGQRLDRPSGWLALGKVQAAERAIDGWRVVVVTTPGSHFDVAGVLGLYQKTLPLLAKLLAVRPAAELLLVSGPDPMWRGGLSGEDSFYLHENRPVRTPDRTSPPLHELFHVLAPFHPSPDAHWLAEGLAEFYSLELQRRAGLVDDAGFQRGLDLFARFGKWHVDLTIARDDAATNNTAPLVLHAIDRAVVRYTKGARNLDDVVAALTAAGDRLTTPSLLRAVNSLTGHNFAAFFQRHIYKGEPLRGRPLAAGERPREARPVTGRVAAESLSAP